MDAAPASAAPPVAVPPRPRLVEVATVLVIAAAALNTAIGVLVAVTAARSGLDLQPALVAFVVIVSVGYAAGVLVLALLFRAGRPWARAALVSAAALSLLTLFAPNALNLGVILLLVAACVLVYRRSVGEWVRALQGKRPV